MEQTNLNQTAAAVPASAENFAPALKKAASRYGWALVELAGVTLVLQVVLSTVLALIPGAIEQPWALWVMTFVPEFCFAFPILYLIVRKMPVTSLAGKAASVQSWLGAFCASIAVMFAGNLIGTGLSTLLSGGSSANPLGTYVSETSILSVLVTVILAPIVEELMFRKLMIDRLAGFGKWTAIIVSALCFGLFHMNLYQFFYAFGIGIVLGWYYVRTGKVRYTILLHMAINFMGSVVAVQAVAQSAAGTALGTGLFVAYLVLYYAIVITGIVLLIVKRKKYLPLEAAPQQVEKGIRKAMATPGMIVYTVLCIVAVIFVLVAPALMASLG